MAALAAEKVRGDGLRLMGEGGLLPELAQHLMQAALEAEMDEHLAAEAGRVGGRGSRSGGNTRNGYRSKKVMTEVGTVTVQIPRDRLGTFQPRMLPKYSRRTGALDDLVISLTAKGLASGGDRLAPRTDVRHDDNEGDHLHHHGQGPGVDGGMAHPPAGRGLPGRLHRRRARRRRFRPSSHP